MSQRYIHFHADELAVCPRCGEKRGQRASIYYSAVGNDKQRYCCKACGKNWRGPLPEPPVAPCPYCGGHCRRRGKAILYEKKPSPLMAWFDRCNGIGPERKIRETAQRYRCTVCGKSNTELWKPRMPAKAPDGPFTYQVTLYLNLASVRLLNARCTKKGMSYSQALRALFRNASYPKICGSDHVVYSGPPAIENLPRLPRVTQLTKANYLPRRPGRRILGPLLMYSVRLDPVAYYGLLRTMYHNDMTRQEAARFLISVIKLNG